MIPTSCCRTPTAVLSLLSCSANRLVTSVCALPKASKEKDASSCVRAPHPHTLVHFRDVIAPSSMPWGLQGPEIYRSHLHMARHLTDRRFFLHVTSPFLCRPYYIYTVLTPRHSAYATWGVICQFLTGQGYFSYANSCLHGLFFLMSFGFLSPGFGVVVQGRVLTEDGGTMEWRHGSEMERKEEREVRQHRRVEDRSSPAGGSPQATSDIPLSDGLMRLPWHFFLPT